MRIAVTGAHSQGKSTFVRDWVACHPQYIHEEEPFRVLHAEGYDIRFHQESHRFDNGLQMYYNISRVNAYSDPGDCVIFDRCPVDYIAYSQYTANHRTTDIDDAFVGMMIPAVRQSLQKLDWLIFFPVTNDWPVQMEDDGIRPVDLSYRDEVDAIFKQIYRDQRWDVMPERQQPRLLELWGSREQRLQRLQQVLHKPT